MDKKVSDILNRAGDTTGDRVKINRSLSVTHDGDILEDEELDLSKEQPPRFVLTGKGGSLPVKFVQDMQIDPNKSVTRWIPPVVEEPMTDTPIPISAKPSK